MGSTLAVWLLFLPILVVLGGVLAWFVPYWLKAPREFFWSVRLATGLLVADLALSGLFAMPRSILEGQNLGYKRMGLSALLVLLGGGFTWLALYWGTGIVGLAVATMATTLLTGILFLQVMRTYTPWFGIARPSFEATRRFLGLSWWFLAWHMVMRLMTASDVVVLGMLGSPELVTTYSLTRYAPETLISVVAMVALGIMPGLGGIIGSRNLERAARVRTEIMSFTWLVITVLGSTVLLWNRAFLGLWVGERHYAGAIPALLIVIVAAQFALLRNDANIIDLTLDLRRKVLIGALSIVLSLVIAGILIKYFQLGIVGLCLGLIASCSVLSLAYPLWVGRLLGISLWSQLRSALRPAVTVILLFSMASESGDLLVTSPWFSRGAWV